MTHLLSSRRTRIYTGALVALIAAGGSGLLMAQAAGGQSGGGLGDVRPDTRAIPPAQTKSAQPAEPNPEAFRPEVATPLKAADDLIKAGKNTEAMAKIREAEQVPDRTAVENYVLNRMRGIVASSLGDMLTATRSFEAVIASGRSPPAEQLRLAEALAVMYFKADEYPKAISWTTRYLDDGGTNPEIRMLQVRSMYLSGDYAGAAKLCVPWSTPMKKPGRRRRSISFGCSRAVTSS